VFQSNCSFDDGNNNRVHNNNGVHSAIHSVSFQSFDDSNDDDGAKDDNISIDTAFLGSISCGALLIFFWSFNNDDDNNDDLFVGGNDNGSGSLLNTINSSSTETISSKFGQILDSSAYITSLSSSSSSLRRAKTNDDTLYIRL